MQTPASLDAKHSDAANSPIARARKAAEQVFDLKDPDFEPTNSQEASEAVQRLGELFAGLPGAAAHALDAARSSGSLVSSDRLQSLAEIVQNADDAGAWEVRFMQTPAELLASHNGAPVRLTHVLALAMPWLTTKADDPSSVGRFGIGLSTLRSLSTSFEVHSDPYHVKIGDPTVVSVQPPDLPSEFSEPGWTTLRIPLQAGALQSTDLETWLDRWDDSALLFLRHVASVTLLDLSGGPIRRLALSRRQDADSVSGSESLAVSRVFADTADGRSWAVYSADVSSPAEVERAQKATPPITPVAVALSFDSAGVGQIYAGLPVAPTPSPLFANAQFDPLMSREGLADTGWNRALVDVVADLWSEAVLDFFGRDPQAAWHAMPLPYGGDGDGDGDGESASGVIGTLEMAILKRARRVVASRLSFPVPGLGQLSLSELAVEDQPLEGILQEAEIAQLAGLNATLPSEVRDPAGRWRLVLKDWREHGAALLRPVSVERALDLLDDKERSVDSTIALVAAALEEDLSERLLRLPCVIAHDGQRLVPPAPTAAEALCAEATPLAEQLGIATLLHPAHLADDHGAPTVLGWLRKCGALLSSSDDREVVRRLARAGRSKRPVGSTLTDEQVQALRDAFEHITPSDRVRLGPDVGRAIQLEAYTYDKKGQKRSTSARPADAYLPRAIDTYEGFAVAAGKSPALIWLSGHYAKSLRSQAGRQGIGALQLLRLLDAETAPRLRPHPEQWQRYDRSDRLGLGVEYGPEARSQALKDLRADYTLDDHHSPDLDAVIRDISRERRGERRRKRAGALLAALGRAWDRSYSGSAEVDAVAADYRWVQKGSVRDFWLAQVGDVAWLDDESGTARKPVELRRRTPGNEALYGQDSSKYLHADLDQSIRLVVLTALGVSSDPRRSELVKRLGQLRHASDAADISPDDLRHSCALVYRALAQGITTATGDSDLTMDQLLREFRRGRLMFTKLGWLSPQNVLMGPPIFGDLRAFALAIKGCEPLWRRLYVRRPSPNDCLEVLREVARRREDAPDPDEEVILRETFQVLAGHHTKGTTVERRKLAQLTLWTSNGWRRKRPVFATDDPVLDAGLRDLLPIWQPGVELETVRSLLESLKITEIRATEAEVINPDLAQEHEKSTELFRRAVELLRDDLQRNDPGLADSLTVPWDSLDTYIVKIHPSLALTVTVTSDQLYDCVVRAKVDIASSTVFIQSEAWLAREAGGGRALAALFENGGRRVAQAWLAACDRAEEGIEAQRVESARERAAREEAEYEDRLVEFQEGTAQRRSSSQRAAQRGHASTPGDQRAQQEQSPPTAVPRILVEPETLTLVDPEGRIDDGSPTAVAGTGGRSAVSSLSEPRNGFGGRQSRTSYRAYTDVDRENVGMALLRMVLGSEQADIVDLRNQRGVGADAVDELKNFYELKVSAGSEPYHVRLTGSEVQRALSTPDFFLVVVSNVEEGDDAWPTVRIIVDPLKQLQPADHGSITLSGVREAKSLIYEFAPIDDQEPPEEGE